MKPSKYITISTNLLFRSFFLRITKSCRLKSVLSLASLTPLPLRPGIVIVTIFRTGTGTPHPIWAPESVLFIWARVVALAIYRTPCRPISPWETSPIVADFPTSTIAPVSISACDSILAASHVSRMFTIAIDTFNALIKDSHHHHDWAKLNPKVAHVAVPKLYK